LAFTGSAQKIESSLIGKKVIIRTYSAGVHYGEIAEKEGNEVILKNSRRLWYWKTQNKGISLSEIANHGVHKESKVCEPVDLTWLQPVEIIICTKDAIKSIEGADVFKA
jgi:ferredoxin-fold anticodon binding domain-containing protein